MGGNMNLFWLYIKTFRSFHVNGAFLQNWTILFKPLIFRTIIKNPYENIGLPQC